MIKPKTQNNLQSSASQQKGGGSDTILQKLRVALRSDGDFPVRAKAVMELRTLANNPNTNVHQITEIILRDPSLGTRVLHFVNSSIYHRPVPIMTISQAVMQIGMRSLSELCAGLVLMKKFVPAAQRGGIFADNVKKSILNSLITSALAKHSKTEGIAEQGYLAGTFCNLGYLLLAYYFPQIYEAAAKRAEAHNHDITQSITEIIGMGGQQLNLAVVDALEIPQYYRDLLVESYKPLPELVILKSQTPLALAMSIGGKIADVLVASKSRQEIDNAFEQLTKLGTYTSDQFLSLMAEIPLQFVQHCETIEMNFLTLQEHVVDFSKPPEEPNPSPSSEATTSANEVSSQFQTYLQEIQQAVQNTESVSSVITNVMEALAYGLKYDRVLLMFADENNEVFTGKMSLGKKFPVDPKSVRRAISPPGQRSAPDVAAFHQGAPQIFGDPLFDDGWPFAALPIGHFDRAVGVIYADRIQQGSEENKPLDCQAQFALATLSDLLDHAVKKNNARK